MQITSTTITMLFTVNNKHNNNNAIYATIRMLSMQIASITQHNNTARYM